MESRGDARYGLANYAAMGLDAEIYGCRPSTSLQQLSPRHMAGRQAKEGCYDGAQPAAMGLDQCPVGDDGYAPMQAKKSPPGNGKKTKGRVKIKMEYIENKLRRYTTFSKRKTGIMKKAYELSTLTGTQVMLLVASETGHVYTFATRKLQPMITSEAGKALIQTCLNSPDPPGGGSAGGGADQRMSATGFEETELTYNISDEDSKDEDGTQGDEFSSSDEDVDVPEEGAFKTEVKPEEITCKPIIHHIPDGNPSPPRSTTLTQPLDHLSVSLQQCTSKTSTQIPQIIPPPQLQALPLLVQTPAGVGYATLPNGMILGMIQGMPNSSQQLVAIPQNSVPQLPSMQTAVKEKEAGGSSFKKEK